MEEEIKKYREILKQIFRAFTGIPFDLVVETFTEHRVLRVTKITKEIRSIGEAADSLMYTYGRKPLTPNLMKEKSGKVPGNFRQNEAGRLLELLLVEELRKKKSFAAVELLGAPGYPDIKLADTGGNTYYLEVKATTRPHTASPRDFYFSPGVATSRKIDSDAYHLLLGFILEKTASNVFLVTGWKLVDLSRISVSLKLEFNTSNPAIYSKDAILLENSL